MAHRPARRCSECGKTLEGKTAAAKTCSAKCRAARHRRLARIQRDNVEKAHHTPETRELRSIVDGEIEDQAKEVAREELRPVVREAMTEEVMRAISGMVGLLPRVVEAISEDLDAEDPNVRQRAYSLAARYLLGKDTLVAPESEHQGGLTVNFQLPRPGDEDSDDEAPVVDAEEMKICDMCSTEKPFKEFEAGSDRCIECFMRMQSKTQELLNDADPDQLRVPTAPSP